MAWTATLTQVNKDWKNPSAVVLFTDSKYKQVVALDLQGHTSASLRARVEALRKGYEDSYAFIDSLTLSFDLTPDAKPDDSARQKYFKDLNTLQSMKAAIANGVMKESDPAFLGQQDLVKSEFLPEYVGG